MADGERDRKGKYCRLEEKRNTFPLLFSRFFRTFAADMHISRKIVNLLLAVAAAGLLAVIIASVMEGK